MLPYAEPGRIRLTLLGQSSGVRVRGRGVAFARQILSIGAPFKAAVVACPARGEWPETRMPSKPAALARSWTVLLIARGRSARSWDGSSRGRV